MNVPAGRAAAAGWAMSGLAIAFCAFDAVMKFVRPAVVIQASAEIGYSADLLPALGATLLLATALYAAPPTAVLGAVLLTGYLGGAVASHLRHHDPLLSHVLFGVYVGVVVWGGLYLRDGRLRALFPIRAAQVSTIAESSRP